MMKSALTILLVWLTFTLALPAKAVLAEIANEQSKVGDWHISCTPESPGVRQCWISQAATIEATGEQLLEIGIGFKRPFDGAELLLILPLGISLHSPPKMFVDGEYLQEFKVDFCLSDGCYSRYRLPSETLEQLLHMSAAELKVQSGAGKELILPISGRGSRAAFNSTEQDSAP